MALEPLADKWKAFGWNVLFMDGHVEFLKYPSEQPATKAMAMTVGGIGASLDE